MIILDIGAPASLAGVSWMSQFLNKFGFMIQEMKATECDQVFRFGPSRQCTSQTMVELPLVVTRLDGKRMF